MNAATLPLDGEDVEVAVCHGLLGGRLYLPARPRGAVLVALPGGIGRLGRLERFAASALAQAGFATLLIDLLTEDEDDTGTHLDVPLLADRLLTSARWLAEQRVSSGLQLGYLGVGGAATAAVFASALEPGSAFAVVSRGDCASLWASSLPPTQVPTLFIATGCDSRAHQALRDACGHASSCKVELVDGSACDRVNALSTSWFERWLGTTSNAARAD